MSTDNVYTTVPVVVVVIVVVVVLGGGGGECQDSVLVYAMS